MHIKTEDFYKDIADDVERWFDTSNFNKEDNRSLSIGKYKKVVGMFKDELGGRIMTEFCALRAKAYAFLIEDFSIEDYEKNRTVNKKAKSTKKCIVKREIIFKNYVDALFNDTIIIKSQLRFRSDHHKVYTEEVNKIALSSNDDKRTQTFDKVTTYPYGANAFMVRKNEMLSKNKKNNLSIKMEKNMNKNLQSNNKSQEITSELAISRNKLQSLKSDIQKVISEQESSRNKLDSFLK